MSNTMGTTSTSISLADLRVDPLWAYRDGLDRWPGAAALRASVRRCGVLVPLEVTPISNGYLLVDGFRRLELLREREPERVPVTVVEGERAELFVRVAERHAGQGANLREVARAVRAGLGLGLSLEQVGQRILPPLGLEPSRVLAERHLELLELPQDLLDLLVDKGLSLRRCLPFCRLARADAEAIVAVARGLQLGARQLEEVTWSLVELAAREGLSPAQVAVEIGLLGPRAEESGALERLDARRLPETTRRRQELDRLCEGLGGEQLEVRYDRNLARQSVELLARVGSRAELEQLAELLRRRASGDLLQRILEALGG
jgi:ParB-like chromosome segregation protein Spo0J